MEKHRTKSLDSVGRFNGNTNISIYDKAIKRYGFLTRCEERIIFERIVTIQNEIIKDLIKHDELFKFFNSKISDAVYNNTFLDLIHFDANEMGDMEIDDIIDTYSVFFELCESATGYSELENIINLVKFSNDFFEEIIQYTPKDIYNNLHLEHRIAIIETYRGNIFEHNTALAIKQALGGSYSIQFLSVDDIIQEAMVGLKKAIVKYNPYVRTKFSTLAIPWISAEITRAIDNKERSISIPCNILGTYSKSIKKLNRLIHEKGSILDINSIVKELDDQSFYHVETHFLDLDARVSDHSHNNNALSLHEVISDENVIDSMKTLELVELKNSISNTIKKLPEKEKFIIDSLFGLSTNCIKLNNSDIMDKLNVKTYEYNKLKMNAYSLLKEEFETISTFSSWKKTLENT